MINRKILDSKVFNEGSENPPLVTVIRSYGLGCKPNGNKAFEFYQNGKTITLSEETLEKVLRWGRCELGT